MRRWKIIAPALLLLCAAVLLAQLYCPRQGCGFTYERRAANRLKNRDALPQDKDFDSRVTLAELLRPGEDGPRWSEGRAAGLEGYVVAVSAGGVEAANCFSLTGRDTHIELALKPDARPTERVVVEVTWRTRDLARRQGLDWSTSALARDLPGRRCRFEGWLFFDRGHDEESLNTAPGNRGDWRATAWELHPVTRIEVLP
ncbi:MAG TPA: hypothetical protein VF507_02490 [Pyrinomonadaceae bacterium]|jgi:hypothetical protein